MSAFKDPLDWGAAELAGAICDRRISAGEYAATLEAACRRHGDLNAYISQDFAQLHDAARTADRSTAVSALHGVPIGIKDNIDTVDLPTSGGTPALKGNRPPKNAPVMERLFGAGALLAGKLNMHELAFGGTNDNLAFGRAPNPIDRTRTAGGSSGGSAVAVAARLATAALGSDTAGSIRVPAALCGIFGFRPTLDRYPGAGVVPIAHGRDSVGPMARALGDIALLDSVLAADPTPLSPPPLDRIRIGIDRTRFFDTASTDVQRVLDRLIDTWRSAGVTIIDVAIDRDAETSQFVTQTVIGYEYMRDFEAYLTASAPHLTFPDIIAQAASPILRTRLAERWDQRAATSAADYQKAIGPDLARLRAVYAAAFAKHDIAAILMPATHDVALPFGGDDDVVRGGKAVSSWFYFRNTAHATIIGAPSLALPAGRDPANLPIGALLDGLPGRDRELIAVATALDSIGRDQARPSR